ncbi:hypothetical protein DY000_02044469 [Brassica cretica]|uniref:Uncharacterized protein n=1 Tax=Brassica cretica TaxID=69181 RepID=A0ABQ7F1J3_BRACR|nr:hypothetical protein DY000_02044469 [Brassica cretica]
MNTSSLSEATVEKQKKIKVSFSFPIFRTAPLRPPPPYPLLHLALAAERSYIVSRRGKPATVEISKLKTSSRSILKDISPRLSSLLCSDRIEAFVSPHHGSGDSGCDSTFIEYWVYRFG